MICPIPPCCLLLSRTVPARQGFPEDSPSNGIPFTWLGLETLARSTLEDGLGCWTEGKPPLLLEYYVVLTLSKR